MAGKRSKQSSKRYQSTYFQKRLKATLLCHMLTSPCLNSPIWILLSFRIIYSKSSQEGSRLYYLKIVSRKRRLKSLRYQKLTRTIPSLQRIFKEKLEPRKCDSLINLSRTSKELLISVLREWSQLELTLRIKSTNKFMNVLPYLRKN